LTYEGTAPPIELIRHCLAAGSRSVFYISCKANICTH
jgi:hypothetical protein